MSDFQITVYNHIAKTVISIFRKIPQVQTSLMLHPSFTLEDMPVIVMKNDEEDTGIEVGDVS